MLVNSDFSARVVLRAEDADWVASPESGVERRMLDRIGDEVARATSVVRYAPGSRFVRHVHDKGEEFLVLDGTFSDEHGDYPVGTYVRNPPGSAHAPFSAAGCTIFVKLRQFDPADLERVVVDTRSAAFQPGRVEGVSLLPLHRFGGIATALARWAPGAHYPLHGHPGGEEILVLQGSLADELGVYPAGSWIRSPHGSRHAPFSRDGALILVKTGHLAAA